LDLYLDLDLDLDLDLVPDLVAVAVSVLDAIGLVSLRVPFVLQAHPF